jgi:hypothetical protein
VVDEDEERRKGEFEVVWELAKRQDCENDL